MTIPGGIPVTEHHFYASLFLTPVTAPSPLCLPIQNYVEGSHAEMVTKDHTAFPLCPAASSAPACAQSTTQHSQVNYCESHQHPNSAVLRHGDQLTFETNFKAASYYSMKRNVHNNVNKVTKIIFTFFTFWIKELENRFQGWNLILQHLRPQNRTFRTVQNSLMMI